MDIETYAQRHPQFASDDIEAHLLDCMTSIDFTTLLDVGCGSGRLIEALASSGLLQDVLVQGVDLSQSQVYEFHSRIPDVKVAVDNAEDLRTVRSKTIDFLISTQVLEHVDDTKMLAAVQRVLTPNGTAYISTVFKRRWARFIWRTQGGEWALDPTHVREYTDETQFLGPLEAAGLVLLDSRKTPVSYAILDFVMHRLHIESGGFLATRVGQMARRVRIRIPGYFIWSLVLRRPADTT